MPKQDIVQILINAAGQSRQERLPPGLAPHFADIDERSTDDLLTFLKRFAGLVNFHADDPTSPSGDWRNFFPFDEGQGQAWLAGQSGSVPPHLALISALLKLYREPQAELNRFTARHLDFYYQEVLRFARHQPRADVAHIQLILKKQAAPVLIGPGMQFSAGKDATGVERIYKPLTETVINHARIGSLRAIYRDAANHGRLHVAPVANSADGLGEAFATAEPRWPAFGTSQLQSVAEIGFALASPVLRLAEGQRQITVELTLDNISSGKLAGFNLADAFKLYLSAEKSWLGPFTVTPELSGSTLRIRLELGEDQAAAVDYDPDIHGYHFAARAPLLQVLLNNERGGMGPARFDGITLRKAKISVKVSGITSLALESDAGTLNPNKAFQPFGPQPRRGARFLVGYPEAFAKKLSELELTLKWKSPPSSFSSHYSGYASVPANADFTVSGSFKDGGSWNPRETNLRLFDSSNAQQQHSIKFTTAPAASAGTTSNYQIASALGYYNASWAQTSFSALLMQNPVFFPLVSGPPPARAGFLSLSLNRDFLHQAYRKEYVAKVMAYSKQSGASPALQLLNEPYTPEVETLSLAYVAHSDEVDIAAPELAEFARDDLQFFHIDCFGQMREHAYQRGLFSHVLDKSVSLLARHEMAGELLIGLENLNPGDSLSLLFQVAEGSADPLLARQSLQWSLLCDNYWKPLSRTELVADTTDQLLASGLLRLVIPREATLENTLMPDGLIWLKAGIKQDAAAVCQLIDIVPNAIAVRFEPRGNDPKHLASALPAGSIGKLKVPVSGVAKVLQPYASFGGALAEDDPGFRTRVAERLRHKHQPRCIWDIERMLLEAFPGLHRVKCIPHARPGNWLAPGNVTVIVVPDLTNRNATDPLQPRTDSHTLAQVHDFLVQHGGMQIEYFVRNPRYQVLELAFKVRFRPGYEFNYYSQQLNQDLLRYLSPWAFSASGLEFGGTAMKSVLLDFVEERPYVDYLGDFMMHTYFDPAAPRQDTNQALPLTPDAILVSARQHAIVEYL